VEFGITVGLLIVGNHDAKICNVNKLGALNIVIRSMCQ